MNLGKGLRDGGFFNAYREEESAFKCTFDVGMDSNDEEDGDDMIENGVMEVETFDEDDYDDDDDDDDDDEDDEEEIEEEVVPYNEMENGQSTDDEKVTKNDMEEMIRILRKESTKDKEKLFHLEEEIRKVKRESIFHRREMIKREVSLSRCKLERYLKQNVLLKGLCFQKMSERYDQNLQKQLNQVVTSINLDCQQLSSIEVKKGLTIEMVTKDEAKSVQTNLSDISKGITTQDGLIESQYRLNQRLRQKLTEERQRRKLDDFEPCKMMVTLEEHREISEKSGEIELIWTKSNESIVPNQSSGSSSPSTSTNGDSKVPEKFYVCKCGQKFVKVDKRMRKMDKNYTGISATTAYSIYRNHFSQCPVYLKDAIMCDVCQDVFYSIPCLKVHIRSKHPDCVDLLEKYKHKYVCLCGRSFKNYSQECTALKALRKHAVSCAVYRSQAILCEICGVPFLEENHLENHIRMAHKDYYSSKKLSSPTPS